MFDYADLASTASELIDEFGSSFQLKRTVNAESDTTLGTVEGSTQSIDGRAAPWDFEHKDIDGDSIRVDDVRLLLSVAAVPSGAMPMPVFSNMFLYDGKWWNVITCKVINRTQVPVAFIVQGRK
jgi:hypothetical protein